MPSFSQESKLKLQDCHPDLQRLMNEAIKYVDFTVVCGYRGEKDQKEAFKNKYSTKQYPNSKHNKQPSVAVDIVPYPTGYKDTKNQILLAGFILGLAEVMNIKIRWGGDWNQNDRLDDEKGLIDYPHFELV